MSETEDQGAYQAYLARIDQEARNSGIEGIPATLANQGINLTAEALAELSAADVSLPHHPDQEYTTEEIQKLMGYLSETAQRSWIEQIERSTGVKLNLDSNATLSDQK